MPTEGPGCGARVLRRRARAGGLERVPARLRSGAWRRVRDRQGDAQPDRRGGARHRVPAEQGPDRIPRRGHRGGPRRARVARGRRSPPTRWTRGSASWPISPIPTATRSCSITATRRTPTDAYARTARSRRLSRQAAAAQPQDDRLRDGCGSSTRRAAIATSASAAAPGESYLLKQGVAADSGETLANEVALYRRLAAAPAPIAACVPRLYGHDAQRGVLILEWIENGQDLDRHHATPRARIPHARRGARSRAGHDPRRRTRRRGAARRRALGAVAAPPEAATRCATSAPRASSSSGRCRPTSA